MSIGKNICSSVVGADFFGESQNPYVKDASD
jgi:hypothetical protein